MTSTEQSKSSSRQTFRAGAVLNRIADRIDLAIDVLTLGQYGLEQVEVAEAKETKICVDHGRRIGRELRAQPARRRGDCEPSPAMSWDWPHAHRDAISG